MPLVISVSVNLDAHNSYSAESVSIHNAYSVSFCKYTGYSKLNFVGVTDGVDPAWSIEIPILTAGESISIIDSITAPLDPDPVPRMTTEGGSVYPEPARTKFALYILPPETFTVPEALLPPGSCGLSIVITALLYNWPTFLITKSTILPESFAIDTVKFWAVVLLNWVNERISKISLWRNKIPLWLFKTNVYTWSLFNTTSPTLDGVNILLFLSITFSIGPEAPEVLPKTFSPIFNVIVPFVKTFKYVLGSNVVSVPGTIYFPGFPVSTLERYTLNGIVLLLFLKNNSISVTKTPPSKFSTLKVWLNGFGLSLLLVILSTSWTPSFALKWAGIVEIIPAGFSGKVPTE